MFNDATEAGYLYRADAAVPDDDAEYFCNDCEEYLCRHGACRECEGCKVCDPPEDTNDL